MLIERIIQKEIVEKLKKYSKAVVLYGARQVGKTTLCRQVIEQVGLNTLALNADERRYIDVLSSRDGRKLAELVAGYDLLFIDEAQRVPDIGINLKILIDSQPKLRVLVTGSSSFELANKVSEPLTGRIWGYWLYPISQGELAQDYNNYELKSQLDERLRWGSYPELFSLPAEVEKTEYLRNLIDNYLYKDVLSLGGIRKPDKIHKLLKLIAFQIGNEVSLTEVASQLEITKETVGRYLDVLTKSFVLFPLTGFSRNLRKEVTKLPKYYFYDIGLRNAVIDNLHSLDERGDIGQLWENWLISERIKHNAYRKALVSNYFWRTYTGAEIDYVEEGGGQLYGYEFKWGSSRKAKVPASWLETYKQADWQLVDQQSWPPFVK